MATVQAIEDNREVEDFEKNLHVVAMKKEFLALQEFESKCGEIRLKNVVCDIDVSLLDIYHGKEIEVSYELTTFDDKFQPTESQKHAKNFLVNSRILDNQVFTFREEGNCYPMDVRSDLELRFKVIKPAGFNFEGRNLFLRQPVSLKEALLCSSMEIRNIDETRERITLDAIISPSTVVRVEGRGFVLDEQFHYRSTTQKIIRGDLFITFFIEFPEFLAQEQKETLKRVLQPDASTSI